MAGHSKWANIKHGKAIVDAKRSAVFTKLSREIIVAAKQGGPNPDANVRLRLAVEKARDSNMPRDNIDRAIQRATGGGEGFHLEEITYEGYAPGGAAVILTVVTDNRTRVVGELRNVFSRAGGRLGEAGSVAWQFESKGVITLEVDPAKAEEIALTAIDAGAEDVKVDKGWLEVYTSHDSFDKVRKALEAAKLKPKSAEISMVPKAMTPLDDKAAEQTLKLLDKLEDMDDVHKVYTNGDFPDAVLERYRAA
ncbi:MAG: YebC/PmpR family DNA-binding transcriptional regulator [Dehalococcoidia bacterium]|nr:YebC/PmpR family DNA-binding transcriptional regulator [Dehalococcoidia bacterium]